MRGFVTCAATAALFLGYSGSAFAGAASAADRAEETARQQQIQELAEKPEPPNAVWYVEAGPAYFDMDAVNGFGAAIDDVKYDFIRQPDNGLDFSSLGVKGAVGLVQPIKDGNKRLLGRVDAAWVKHDEDINVALVSGEYLDTLPIDGTTSTGAIVSGAGAGASGSAEAKFYRVGMFLGLGKESQNDKRRTLIGGGLYGDIGALNFASRMDGLVPGGFISLDEKSKIWAAGPMVMGEVAFALSDRVDFTLGGRAAALYSNGSLDAQQQASNLASTLKVKDDDSGFAYMGEVKAGFDFKASDRVTLSLFGSGEGRNDYYKIINPRSGPGLNAASAASYNPGPARLDQDVQIIASVGAAAKFAF